MDAAPIRLLIADNHPIVHSGLSDVLREAPHISVVGTPTSFAEVLEQLTRTEADVLVLDLSGMGEPALTMISRLRRAHPRLRVIIFSSSVDLAQELLQAGALGYVVKEELNDHMIRAIQAAADDEPYISPMVEEYLARASYLRGESQLRPQELSVLRLLVGGMGTVQIAEALGIDPRSVQNYITRLRRKTGCAQRTQLVAWYERRYPGAGR